MSVSDLPAVNAVLNALAGIWLASGYISIRRGRRGTHRAFMLAAAATSILFLISYLTYHAQAGSTRFQTPGWIRTVYLTILGTHTVLAATLVPLAAITLLRALRSRFDSHRRIARFTFPVWMYVSVTGVVIYFMLYHLDPRLHGG